MPKVGIIAAMRREIAPLVRGFSRRQGRNGTEVYEQGSVRLICCGMGAERASEAARAMIAEWQPELLLSAGFAGGLKAQHRAGDLLVCGKVIDEQRSEWFLGGSGAARLVTCTGVLNGEDKRKLAEEHDADAVDMEAAAVARVACEKGIAFVAVKAISDEVDFEMPPMDRFIDAQGKFETVKLLAYAAWRPSLWPVLARLEKNTKLASEKLCAWLEEQTKGDFQQVFAGARVYSG